MKKPLDPQYRWLAREPGPKMLLEALKLHGVEEFAGEKNSPEVLSWAHELGLPAYNADSIPWCGLFAGIVAKRAGKTVVKDPLWAANWLKWGTPCEPELGAIAVFSRKPQGNHVAIIIGEDATHYHVLGGNQKDSVRISRLEKGRLRGCRAIYRNKPANIRKVTLSPTGEVSTNEA